MAPNNQVFLGAILRVVALVIGLLFIHWLLFGRKKEGEE